MSLGFFFSKLPRGSFIFWKGKDDYRNERKFFWEKSLINERFEVYCLVFSSKQIRSFCCFSWIDKLCHLIQMMKVESVNHILQKFVMTSKIYY